MVNLYCETNPRLVVPLFHLTETEDEKPLYRLVRIQKGVDTVRIQPKAQPSVSPDNDITSPESRPLVTCKSESCVSYQTPLGDDEKQIELAMKGGLQLVGHVVSGTMELCQKGLRGDQREG